MRQTKHRGTCVEWDKQKGWGSIECQDARYLVHHRELLQDGWRSLEIGDKVLFKLGFYKNRLVAKQVSIYFEGSQEDYAENRKQTGT